MVVSDIVASIDREIAQLRQARALLVGGAAQPKTISIKAGKSAAGKGAKRGKRLLSPEGRKRIAEAQKKRWAARRKAAAA